MYTNTDLMMKNTKGASMKEYINAISMQMRLMINKKEFQITYIINAGYVLLTYLYYVIYYWGDDVSTVSSSSAVFSLLSKSVFFDLYISIVPFLVVLPFAMSFVDDKKNNILPGLQVRSGVKAYYISKAVACFLGGFFSFFIPMMIGMLLNVLTFPGSGITFLGDYFDMNFDAAVTGADVLIRTRWAGLWFPRLFISSPDGYNILFCTFFSIAMGISSTFLYIVSFFIKRQKLLLMLPFFLIVSVLNIMDEFNMEHPPYVCFKVMQYITVNAMYGKDPLYIYFFLLLMILVSVFGINRQIQRDQLD